MTDLTKKPQLHLPDTGTGRLGWWHEVWRRALLAGHRSLQPAPVAGAVPLPIQELALTIEDYRSQFATAARTLGADYKGGYWLMYFFAPVAVLSSASEAVFTGSGRMLSVVELVFVLSILLLFLLLRRRKWQERWVRARRTAEHLRYLPLVAPFVQSPCANWYEELAARRGLRIIVDEEVTRVCAWLGHGNATEALRLEDPAFVAGYRIYVDNLLAQQIHYHADKAAMEHTLGRRISHASNAFFWITVGCAALLFLQTLPPSGGPLMRIPGPYLRIFATVLPAFGAGLRGVLAQGESHQVAALSEGMSLRLGQLRLQMQSLPSGAESIGELENIVWNAAQELLSEADTWMRLQESVPLSVAC
jgi:hypothetical protein